MLCPEMAVPAFHEVLWRVAQLEGEFTQTVYSSSSPSKPYIIESLEVQLLQGKARTLVAGGSSLVTV